MTRFAAIFPVILVLSGTPTLADPKPSAANVLPGSLHGDYYFYATDQKPGEKICAETWRFGDDGTLTTFSGEEVVTEHFRLELREDYNTVSKATLTSSWLITTGAVSNGKPDCLGSADPLQMPEADLAVYRAVGGDIVVCWPYKPFAPRPFGELLAAKSDDANTAPAP